MRPGMKDGRRYRGRPGSRGRVGGGQGSGGAGARGGVNRDAAELVGGPGGRAPSSPAAGRARPRDDLQVRGNLRASGGPTVPAGHLGRCALGRSQ